MYVCVIDKILALKGLNSYCVCKAGIFLPIHAQLYLKVAWAGTPFLGIIQYFISA